jgi:pimeloyl-ACP methyl ester carboxylesterase
MPSVRSNGIQLAYETSGEGDCVLFVMGSRTSGQVWQMYQTPALNDAGFRTVTFNNRGVPPSDAPAGKYSLADLVADTKGLIEALGLGPCRIVGTSLGALIAQQLAIHEPQLIKSAVLIGTKARSDAARLAQAAAEREMMLSGIQLPALYQSVKTVFERLSPATIKDDESFRHWLDLFEFAGSKPSRSDGQMWIETSDDHRAELRNVTVPCRVIAFTDDQVTPPHLAAEVAEAIPDCDYVEIDGCGHLGYLERPDPVNEAILAFFENH